MEQAEKLKTTLKSSGCSVTKPRMEVFRVLQKASKPITVTDISAKLPHIDKVSVYRTIELYEKLGVVKRVWTGPKSKVELGDMFQAHHHHFVCVDCEEIKSIESIELEESLHNLEKKLNIKVTQHSFELKGHCGACK